MSPGIRHQLQIQIFQLSFVVKSRQKCAALELMFGHLVFAVQTLLLQIQRYDKIKKNVFFAKFLFYGRNYWTISARWPIKNCNQEDFRQVYTYQQSTNWLFGLQLKARWLWLKMSKHTPIVTSPPTKRKSETSQLCSVGDDETSRFVRGFEEFSRTQPASEFWWRKPREN